MSTVYGYLDILIDEHCTNPIENWWFRYLFHLHKEKKFPKKLLPRKLKWLIEVWEYEMRGGEYKWVL